MTINTHEELLKNNKLPFGVASVSTSFQRIVVSLLQGLKHVVLHLGHSHKWSEQGRPAEELGCSSEDGYRHSKNVLKEGKVVLSAAGSAEAEYLGHHIKKDELFLPWPRSVPSRKHQRPRMNNNLEPSWVC